MTKDEKISNIMKNIEKMDIEKLDYIEEAVEKCRLIQNKKIVKNFDKNNTQEKSV